MRRHTSRAVPAQCREAGGISHIGRTHAFRAGSRARLCVCCGRGSRSAGKEGGGSAVSKAGPDQLDQCSCCPVPVHQSFGPLLPHVPGCFALYAPPRPALHCTSAVLLHCAALLAPPCFRCSRAAIHLAAAWFIGVPQAMLPLYCATRAATVVLALAEVAAAQLPGDPASLLSCKFTSRSLCT